MTSYLDFFVRFGAEGTILGLGHGTTPEEWISTLGDKFEEASRGEGHRELGYGFIEASFGLVPSGGWSCDYLKLAVWTLSGPDGTVPEAVRARYGDFPPRVVFDDIASAAARSGIAVYRGLSQVKPDHFFWFASGGVAFTVLTEADIEDFPDHRVGDVYAVTALPDHTIDPATLRPYP